MSENGWWKQRIGRRSLLRGSAIAGVGLGAASLIGCRTGAPTTGGSAPPTMLGTTAASTSAPKRGGIYKWAANDDPPTWDPFANSAGSTQTFASGPYSRLFMNVTKAGANPFDLPPVGDLAESSESADGQNWVVKIRKGVKFHNKAPLNGRELTTQDIVSSWNRLTAKTSVTGAAFSEYTKLEAVDAYTLKFTMKAPSPTFVETLADATGFYVMSKEVADGGVDVKKQAIGTGPWVLESYESGVRMKFSRNPDYYIKNSLWFDGVERLTIPEYGNRLAQFAAGNIHSISLSADDVLDMRARQPKVQWMDPLGDGLNWVNFSGPAESPNAPWRDERFRQAVSMAIDRAGQNDLSTNASALKKAGVKIDESWNNVVPYGRGKTWWVNPQSAEQGESAKFFKYNLAEAKKLLAAMGGAPKESIPYIYTPQYGKTYMSLAEAVRNYLAELGLNLATDVQDYNSKYVTGAYRGNYQGIAFMVASSPSEIGAYLGRFFGKDPLNRGRVQPPEITSLLTQQATEMSLEKRSALVKRINVLNGEKMYYVPTQAHYGGDWTAFRPEIGGPSKTRSRGTPAEQDPYMWMES